MRPGSCAISDSHTTLPASLSVASWILYAVIVSSDVANVNAGCAEYTGEASRGATAVAMLRVLLNVLVKVLATVPPTTTSYVAEVMSFVAIAGDITAASFASQLWSISYAEAGTASASVTYARSSFTIDLRMITRLIESLPLICVRRTITSVVRDSMVVSPAASSVSLELDAAATAVPANTFESSRSSITSGFAVLCQPISTSRT